MSRRLESVVRNKMSLDSRYLIHFWEPGNKQRAREETHNVATRYRLQEIWKGKLPVASSCSAIVCADPVTLRRTVLRHAEVRGNLFDPAARLCLTRGRHYTPQAFRLSMESRCGRNDMWLLRLRNPLSDTPPSRFTISFRPTSPRKCPSSGLTCVPAKNIPFCSALPRGTFNNIKSNIFQPKVRANLVYYLRTSMIRFCKVIRKQSAATIKGKKGWLRHFPFKFYHFCNYTPGVTLNWKSNIKGHFIPPTNSPLTCLQS